MKYLLLPLLMICSIAGYGQVWLDIAPKIGYGLSGFYNDNVWSDTEHNNQFNTGYSYGAKLGVNIGEYNGFIIEGMMNHGKQEFQHKIGDQRIPNITNWQTLDAGLIYRFNAQGSYLEVGPQMSFLRSVEQTYNGLVLEDQNAFADTYFSAVAGFGGFVAGNEFFTLVMGIRLGYALTDMLGPDAQNLPTPPPASYRQYDSYSGMSPFFAQIQMEFSFGIGGAARAACGRRSYMFGSRYR